MPSGAISLYFADLPPEIYSFAIETMLDSEYLYDYDKDKAIENALTAYVDALDEPYTEYYSPKLFGSYLNGVQESYTGIGIIVTVDDNNRIRIIAPFEDRMKAAGEILNLPENFKAFTIVPVGYPKNKHAQEDRYEPSKIHTI